MRAAKRMAILVGVASLAMVSGAVPAQAHGERTQPSWARTMTATFFDLEYSGNAQAGGQGVEREYQMDVGQVLRLSGKVQISDKWPVPLGSFDKGQIGVLMQGPVLAMRTMKVNGVFASGSIVMHPGDFFSFETELIARQPGLYHIHPRIDLQGKGPIVGAGTWVRIRDTGEDFEYPVTLASGERVDLESYQAGTVYGFHLLWLGLGAVFCVGWLARKRLLRRFTAVRSGISERELSSPRDRMFTLVAGGVTLALIVGSYVYASSQWSTIPIQVRQEAVPHRESPRIAEARLEEARYDEKGRSLRMRIRIHNTTSTPVRVERLVVGPNSLAAKPFYDEGNDDGVLGVDSDAPLQRGEERTLTFTFTTDPLERDRVLATNTALAQIGGVLIVRDAEGQRGWVSLAADLIMA